MCKELSSAKGIVYRIACLASGKSYVGQTGKDLTFFDRYIIKRSLSNRTQLELFSYLKKRIKKNGSTKMSKELRDDIIIYPPERFTVSILAKEIKKDKERDYLELKFIKKFNTLKNGYNIVKNNYARPSHRFPYSLIDLRTMTEVKGENITEFCRSLINKIKPLSVNKLEQVRGTFMGVPRVRDFKHIKGKRWHWTSSIQNLSIYGHVSSWWLKNGLQENMEIVPCEYDTVSGKITMPLLKIKDEYMTGYGRGKPFNPNPFSFSTDPIEDEKRKKTIKNELSEWITKEALIYAKKLAEEYKYTLASPLGPGALTSYLNKAQASSRTKVKSR